MGLLNKYGLKTKLLVGFLVSGLVAAISMFVVSWTNSNSTLKELAHQNLTQGRQSKLLQVKELFSVIEKQVVTLSSNVIAIEAVKQFSSSFSDYAKETEGLVTKEAARTSLNFFYKDQFGKKYQALNDTAAEGLSSKVDGLNDNQLFLQYSYISNNTHPLGSKHEQVRVDDKSTWSLQHEKFHPTFAKYLDKFGYYDIFLVDIKTGNIVYSVFKELDFATSLRDGPYAATNFGKAFQEAAASETEDAVILKDMEPYYPSFEAPASFIASPIFDGKEKVGVLVFQIPVEKINGITTNNKKWEEDGLGKTGETFIVGSDHKVRSVMRQFVENQEEFLASTEALGLSPEAIKYMRLKETTALNYEYGAESAQRALAGESGVLEEDFNGTTFISAYTNLSVAGNKWAMISRVEKGEALSGLKSLLWTLFVWGSISLLVVGVIAFGLASKISSRIHEIMSELTVMSEQSKKNSKEIATTSRKVTDAGNQQASAIQETVATVDEINAMFAKSVEYAEQSSKKATSSAQVANDGQSTVEQMKQAISQIDSSNEGIRSTIVESNMKFEGLIELIDEIAVKTTVINDIVFQTKLLSFNASVEAARAGDHGKGFAVVAEEVGNLARMSGEASKEIESIISSSKAHVAKVVKESGESVSAMITDGQRSVAEGVEVANKCGEVFQEIATNVAEVTEFMNGMTRAAKEQATGISNISQAMSDLDGATVINSEAARETSQLSDELDSSAVSLSEAISKLRVEVDGGSDFEESTLPANDLQTGFEQGKPSIRQAS